MCHQFYLNLIAAHVLELYGVLFVLIGIVAVIGNVLSAIIVWKPAMKQSHSNLILKSLIIADTLVGGLVCPLLAYQLLTHSYLENCNYERIRDFLAISLTSISSLTIAIIAFDRYLLLTKLNNYSKYMSKKKIQILLVVLWIFPPLASSMRYINFSLYRYVFIATGSTSTLAIIVSYLLILKEIHTKRKLLELQRVNIKAVGTSDLSNEQIQEDFQLQIAKKVALLVSCFLVCNIPSIITVIVRTIIQPNELTSSSLQNAYLFSCFVFSLNSSINPFVYASRYPEFQTHLRGMFKRSWMEIERRYLNIRTFDINRLN